MLLASGCREPIVALGGSGPVAAGRAHAEQAFAALGARATDPVRDDKFENARAEFAKAALLPSRVWDDSSVWSSMGLSRRTLLLSGRLTGSRYTLATTRAVPWPSEPAASRHAIHLARLAEDEFAWDTEVAYAIGAVTAADVSAMFAALLSSAEGRGEREIRADYRSAVPRTAAVLGLLFHVDSIRTAHLADSSTLATFSVTMTTSRLERQYPNFAKYLRRYAESARMRWTIVDRSGAHYLDAGMRDGRIQLRVRTRDGRLVATAGPAVPIPDSLMLHGDMTVKVRAFTVGVRRYRSQLTLIRDAHESGFRVVSRQEPEWVLPLVTERFLRTPLRRPFKGDGAMFSMTVHDTTGRQTILLRRMHLEVQESTILRFLGRLGAIAMSDYAGEVEKEEMAWFRQLFAALAADTRALDF